MILDSSLQPIERPDPEAWHNCLLGRACFETLYWNGSGLEGLNEHLLLLGRSAAALEMPPDLPEQLADKLIGWLKSHDELADCPARVKVTMLAGAQDTCFILAATPCPEERRQMSMSVLTAATRRNETSRLSQIKSICYADNVLARNEARRRGADEALLLNGAARPACLAMGNLLLITGKRPCLHTPPVSEGVRPGYMRSIAMKAAGKLGWTIREDVILPQMLYDAHAVCACNSLWNLRNIVRLDGAALPAEPQLFLSLRQTMLEIC